MSEEERQRQMDFILSQQAQFAADMHRFREEQEEKWKQQEERWEKADKRWAETEKGIRALLAIAEVHEREIMAQGEQIKALGERIEESREAGRETDERLNALISTVERIISERRDGGPRQG